MNEQKYRQAMEYIRPGEGFEADTMECLRRRRKRARTVRVVAAGLAAAACAAFVLFALPGLLAPAAELPSVPVAIATPEGSASAQPTQLPPLTLDGSPVDYSSLKFAYTGDGNYPGVPDQTAQMCVIAFSEEMLKRSALVAGVTVEDVRFLDYFDHTHSALFTLRLDKIYYTSLDVSEGDTFTVEQVLYGGCLADSEFSLKPGGRYILPICADEGIIAEYDIDNVAHTAAKQSAYSLIYPFQPMIELTADGGALFFGERDADGSGFGWKSLVDENTVEVVMDVETASGADSWITRMKLRADAGFEDDFQALVDYYCVEGGEDPANLQTAPPGSDITGLEALSLGEALLPEGYTLAAESCWFDVIRKEWNVHFEFNNTESVYDIRLTASGEIIDAAWR